jgi:hypothetical protein
MNAVETVEAMFDTIKKSSALTLLLGNLDQLRNLRIATMQMRESRCVQENFIKAHVDSDRHFRLSTLSS